MKRSSSGFTLIEVLVATTVLSLVLMLTVSAMRMIGSSSSKVIAVVDRNDEMRTVSLFLHDVLRRAGTSGGAQGGGAGGGGTWAAAYSQHAESAYFSADETSVAWLSSSAVVPGSTGQQYLRLSREKDQLVLQSKAYEENEELPNWNIVDDSESLMEGVSDLLVSYRWSPADPWGVQKRDDASLPAAVKIRIQAQNKYWPDIVVKFDNYVSQAQR